MIKKKFPEKNNLEKKSTIKDEVDNFKYDENSSLNDEEFSKVEESLEDLGQIIKKTRIANNLSLESVSGHLHISVKILEAIEDGKPEKGPTSVFFRGLVRTYCQFLELDKTDFIDIIDKKLRLLSKDENQNIKTLKPVFSVKETLPIRNILTFFVIFFGGTLLYYLYFNQAKFDKKSDNLTKINSENQKDLGNIESKNNIFDKQYQVTKDDNSKKIANEDNNANISEVNEIIKPISPNQTNEPLTLEVEALESTWISLAIDNLETIDYRIDADEIQQWIAKKNFNLTIGNTKVVRVLLNGREIETDRTNDLLSNWLVDSSLLP